MRIRRTSIALLGVSALTVAGASQGAAAGSFDPFKEAAGHHDFAFVTAVSPDSALFAGAYGALHRARFKHWDGRAWSNIAGISGTERFFAAVDADGPSDAWAVGSRTDGASSHSLMAHWDGTAWRTVHDGGLGDKGNSLLSDVSAVAPDDVWAVGEDVSQPLTSIVKHWDGSTWHLVPSPMDGYLFSVAATGPDDVWVTGEVAFQGWLFMHWDGRTWSTFPTDNPSADIIQSLAAVAPDDVWAAGLVYDGHAETLIEHWDGTSWTVVPSPNPGGAAGTTLQSVSAVSGDDAWAAGFTWGQTGGTDDTVIEHWDGHEWSVVPSPSPGTRSNWLTDISADSATDTWAAGSFSSGPDPDLEKNLLMHWDGTSWTRLHDVR